MIVHFVSVLWSPLTSRYTYGNEVGSYTYNYSGQVTAAATMQYDISADFVDSTTTAYDPRPSIDHVSDNSLMGNVVNTGNYFLFCV